MTVLSAFCMYGATIKTKSKVLIKSRGLPRELYMSLYDTAISTSREVLSHAEINARIDLLFAHKHLLSVAILSFIHPSELESDVITAVLSRHWQAACARVCMCVRVHTCVHMRVRVCARACLCACACVKQRALHLKVLQASPQCSPNK